MSSTQQNESTAPRADKVDSPLALQHVPLAYDNDHPNESALKLVQEFDPDWKTDDGPIELVKFTDGITNTLTKATKKRPGWSQAEIDHHAILLRAYGAGTAVLIDRQRELRAHTLLANIGLAPPLLAKFDNGLMYRFIRGDVCTPEDLRKPEVFRQVAKRLGQWHGILPISAITSTPLLDSQADQKHCASKDGKSMRPSPNLWTVLQRWIDALPATSEEEKERNRTLDIELARLSSKLGDAQGLDEKNYIFGHCDLLSGNVIVTEPPRGSDSETNGSTTAEKPVSFIDYEYTTPVPAAFDIANHFAEWAGFECDHSAVPTKSERREFIKHYVASFRYHSISDEESIAVDIDFKKDIDQLFAQVDVFRGVPGFYWGIWALIQATISQIDFDYASYAQLRLGEYWAWKAELDGSRKQEGRDMPLRERRWAEE